MKGWKPSAIVLLVAGLSQMAGDVLGIPALRGIGGATLLAPAPKVFSSVQGLETYSTRFFVEWDDANGESRSVELTAERSARIRGPYNRRNVYGAVLAYGPVLATNERTRPMLAAVAEYGLTGDAPLLRELGIEPADIAGPVRLRYEPLPGSDLGDLPTTIEVPLP